MIVFYHKQTLYERFETNSPTTVSPTETVTTGPTSTATTATASAGAEASAEASAAAAAAVGGYTGLSTTDPQAIAAANFAINSEYTIGKVTYDILSASIQIVAGTNYKIQVAVTDITTKTCIVKTYIVLKNLPNNGGGFVLSSSVIENSKCPATTNPSATPSNNTTTNSTTLTTPSAFVTTNPTNVTSTSFVTTSSTATPFVTTTPTPTSAAKSAATLDGVDPNGYIRLALSALHSDQTSSALNYIHLATNVQTQRGNYAAVALLKAAELYTQAIMNPLLNNFDVPAAKLSDAVNYLLVGTILAVLCIANGTSSAVYKNIQQALVALNAPTPNIATAIASVNKSLNEQMSRGNTDIMQKLEDVLKVLNNYDKPELKRLPLTPLQLSLMDFPQILILLDGNVSAQHYSMLWGKNSLDTKTTDNWSDTNTTNDYKKYRGNGQTGGSTWTSSTNDTNNTLSKNRSSDSSSDSSDSTAVPDVIQKFLYSRAMLDAAMNDMVNYLTVNQGYNDLVKDIRHAQKDMNLI
jgi:hypothetical protein